MSKTIALFIEEGSQNTTDFGDLEDKGVTDIIKSAGWFGIDYNILETKTLETLSNMEETNLKLHLFPMQFYNSSNIWTDPINTDQQNLIATNSSQIIQDTEIEGICFDDFYYYPSKQGSYTTREMEDNLISFTNTVKTTIKDTNPNIKLSACLNTPEIGGGNITRLSPLFDFIVPMVYRYSDTSSNFIQNVISTLVTKTGNTKVVPALLTWKSDQTKTLWDLNTIQTDIRTILASLNSYAIFEGSYLPVGMTYPSKKTKYLAPNLFVSCIE